MSRFFALSRTTHGVLDMAAPAFCALLWLGGFPPWQTILLSLATAFAAYTAIYALNDLLGIKCDQEKFARAGINPGYSVEASAQRHPLAQNLLSVRSGLLWACAWFTLALIGSYLLNPVIVLVLLAATGLEVIYCLLLEITPLKTLISGLVKSSGPIAAILVVDASPAPLFLLLVLAWVFCWEIGGQNIPSDWNYTAEDCRANAKTIPIIYGHEKAGAMVLAALAVTVIISAFLPLVSPAPLDWPYIVWSVLIGLLLLLRPGLRLLRLKEPEFARALFNRASYYPLAQFLLIAGFLVGDALLAA